MKYNIEALISHIKNIRWKAFRISNTLKDNLSEKLTAALLLRFLEITRKKIYYSNVTALQKDVLIKTKHFLGSFPELFKEANSKNIFQVLPLMIDPL